MEADYADTNVLVETDWVLQHHKDADVRIVEVDYDAASNYSAGHIPGAVLFDWRKDINDPVTRDIASAGQLQELLSRSGISDDTSIVLYGDFNNWFAAFVFWVLKYYRIQKVKLLNGGRKKWLLEDRPVTKALSTYATTDIMIRAPDQSLRVYKDYVFAALDDHSKVLVDVRSPREFSGELLAPPEYPSEHAQRGGHIPGAQNIPWSQAVNESNGTFRNRRELESLYAPKGVTREKEVITYCRIGERSSHSWFVLKYLLGYPNVRNYDGSWTEWGNAIRYPVER